MARKKKRSKPKGQPPQEASRDLEEGEQNDPSNQESNTVQWIRWFVLAAVALHFAALLVGYSTNFGQSLAINTPMGWINRYLIPTGQNYGERAVEWTHAAENEAALSVQVWTQPAGTKDGQWLELDPALASGRWNNVSRYLGVVLAEDAESELLSEIAFHLLTASQFKDSAQQMRLVRSYTPSFDEQLAISAGQEEYFGGAIEPTVVFQAQVIRSEGEMIGFVPTLSPHRMSPPLAEPGDSKEGS